MAQRNLQHYANANVELGADEKRFEKLTTELEFVLTQITNAPDFGKFLQSSFLSFDDKKETLKKTFCNFVSNETINFLLLLIKENDFKNLGQIIILARKLNLKKDGALEVIAETAIELTAAQKKELEQMLEKKFTSKILLKNQINKQIAAGIKLQINDTELDATIAGKITRLKNKLATL